MRWFVLGSCPNSTLRHLCALCASAVKENDNARKPPRRRGRRDYVLVLAQRATRAGISSQSNPFTRKKRNPQNPSRLIHVALRTYRDPPALATNAVASFNSGRTLSA